MWGHKGEPRFLLSLVSDRWHTVSVSVTRMRSGNGMMEGSLGRLLTDLPDAGHWW